MHAGLRFGVYLAPFHKPQGNPTRALRRDIELIESLERLGYDEAWIGEHHSGGTEIVGAPELLIAAAAERTQRIRLGTGVVPLPYHHPFMVAERLTLLDHLTRGRAMLGVGPGGLPSDAALLGLDPLDLRRRLGEGLEAVLSLLRSEEPVTMETDWFTLRRAALQLRPYTAPHFEVAVAAVASPNGAVLAGRHGIGLLSVGSTGDVGLASLAAHWDVAREEAERAGTTVDRAAWRLVGLMHVAKTREQALADVRYGLDAYAEYLQQTGLFPQLEVAGETFEERAERVNRHDVGVIGTVEDAVEHIERLQRQSGGFGCYLLAAHEWADPEATLRSYDLVSRYVMPTFQGQNRSTRAAEVRARLVRGELADRSREAVDDATARYVDGRDAEG